MFNLLKRTYLIWKRWRLLPQCGDALLYKKSLHSPCMICHKKRPRIFFKCGWKFYWAYGTDKIFKLNNEVKLIEKRLYDLSSI
jgi:hypothetical protein